MNRHAKTRPLVPLEPRVREAVHEVLDRAKPEPSRCAITENELFRGYRDPMNFHNTYACPFCRNTFQSVPWEPGERCQSCKEERLHDELDNRKRNEALDDIEADARGDALAEVEADDE